MGYDDSELSVEAGQPVELYDVSIAATHYRYTTEPADVDVASQTYFSVPVERGGISISKEQESNNLSLTLPADDALAQQFDLNVPGHKCFLTASRYHRNDGTLITIYRGKMVGVSFTDNGSRCVFLFASISAAQGRPIPRSTYMSLCNHLLYDGQCLIDESLADWRKSFVVSAVSGNVITLPDAVDDGADFYKGGFVRFGSDYRMIVAQSGDDMTLMNPFTVSPLGQTVLANAGCDHTRETCVDKFDNIQHFGGFPFVPLTNPFESGL